MILIRSGDLVVSGINAAKGAIAVYEGGDDLPIAATIHYGAYVPNKDRVSIPYLWWLLRSRFFQGLLREHVPGGIKTELKAARLLPIPVPLPPLGEQHRLVGRVEEIAKKIEKARTLRAVAASDSTAVTLAYLNRLFGNPYDGTAGDAPIMEWRRLAEVVDDIADGPHATPTYVEEGVPFLTVLNITSGRVEFRNHKYISLSQHAQYQRRAKAERGDVLISKDGTIGVPCYVDTDREFSFFVSVALVKPKRGVLDGEFLTWALRAPYLQERMKARSRGDMIRHLVLREIRELVVPVGSLALQRDIVSRLDRLRAEVDRLKRFQMAATAELDALLPAILDRAFRGEL